MPATRASCHAARAVVSVGVRWKTPGRTWLMIPFRGRIASRTISPAHGRQAAKTASATSRAAIAKKRKVSVAGSGSSGQGLAVIMLRDP